MSGTSLEILVVDDNAADVRLIQEAFRERKIHDRMNVARDGVEAMAFLRRQGRYADATRPDLIFLDLNLPRKDGREVLAEIRADPGLARIPVVIFTTSRAETDVATGYDLHANCYLVKPVDLDDFIGVIQRTEQFWLSVVTLPPK